MSDTVKVAATSELARLRAIVDSHVETAPRDAS